MYVRTGDGWKVSAGTHGQMLMALYLRDLADIHHPVPPVVCPLAPHVKPAAAAEIPHGSQAELRQEWQDWWQRLLRQGPADDGEVEPPPFSAFDDSPTLQRLMRAHYGSATAWARQRAFEYGALARSEEASGNRRLLEEMVAERRFAPERDGERAVEIALIELPLAEPRAWFVEPHTVILDQSLNGDRDLFLSYMGPIVEML